MKYQYRDINGNLISYTSADHIPPINSTPFIAQAPSISSGYYEGNKNQLALECAAEIKYLTLRIEELEKANEQLRRATKTILEELSK